MLSFTAWTLLVWASAAPVVSQHQSPPGYYEDVAPILFEHCASCHRSGGWAPFTVDNYSAVRDRAEAILRAVRSRSMPPWLPDPDAVAFAEERRLSEAEIETIQRWVDTGRLSGDPNHAPDFPVLAEGWQVGEPDLVIRVTERFTLPREGDDVYRNLVLPIPVTEPRWVRAVELRPEPREVVHHARMLIDTSGNARKLDAADAAPGYDGMLLDESHFPDGHFLGWAPGKVASAGTDGLAWRLRAGSDLVLQLHMLPTGREELVGASVGLFFSEDPPKRSLAILQLGSKTIDIPAGATDHLVQDEYTLPADLDLVSVYPHAHYLGRVMESEAILPDGTRRWLLKIPSWNFFWQDHYRYREPIALPKGTRITMRYLYDNAGASHPVRFGARSSDEMGDLLFQVMPRREEDLAQLREDFLRNEIRQDIKGFEKTLSERPDDPQARHLLALSYVELGRIDDAIDEFEVVIESNPDFADAHYNLANTLVSVGQRKEAIAHLETAIDLSPTNAEAHNNLAILLQQSGRIDEAILHYKTALTARPSYAYAHHNLASALLVRNRYFEALRHVREAIEIRPQYAEAHYTLGRLLGMRGNLEEEIHHYRAAIEIRPDYAEAHNNLATALLAKGRRTEAVAELHRAIAARPDYVLAYLNLAEILDDAGEKSRALELLDRALGVARAAGDEASVREIERRRKLVRR